MGYIRIKCSDEIDDRPEIHKIDYGVMVTNIVGGKANVYMKVKKKRSESNNPVIDITWKKNHCVLYNLNWGTLRAVPATTQVTILCGRLDVAPATNNREYFKEQYR